MHGTPGKEIDPRMHSAEHLLTASLMKVIGCGRPFTTHIEKKKSKADYYFSRELTAEEVLRVQHMVNEAIKADLPVQEEFLSQSAAAALYNLERLPAGTGQNVRIVHMGDYDACPCIGAHVKSTKEIGTFRIISTNFGEGAVRVRFKLDSAKADS